jgi:GrxC family glutaredoxin
MPNLEVYSKEWCPYCAKAKALLKSKGLTYQEMDVTSDETLQQQMIARAGRRTVPQIFFDGVSIGGMTTWRTVTINRLLLPPVKGPLPRWRRLSIW